jgi:Spy/CpxP family protein refolding chaperone
MKKQAIKLAMAGALAAGLALAQTPASAPQAAPAGTAGAKTVRGALRHRMVKALGLTDAQKQQAKAIFQETKTANQPIRVQLQQNRQALGTDDGGAVRGHGEVLCNPHARSEGQGRAEPAELPAARRTEAE